MGKTRLAIQVASAALDLFPHGVWFIELAAVSDPDFIIQTLAVVLGVQEAPDYPLRSAIADHLQERRVLVILDNCEHLIESCAVLVAYLLHTCPELHVLTTSREPLHIIGEIHWRVSTLSFPAAQTMVNVAQLQTYEAVQLFVERARAVSPDFALTDENSAAIADICAQLDGLPLAIELAAVRINGLTPQQIANRLNQCFKLLTHGNRTVLPRQQTLRNTVDWSYQQLTAEEQVVFQQLAVFTGGWTLEAAEAVCAGIAPGGESILDQMAALVNKSLVNVHEHDGQMRYSFLETIRQYADEKLTEAGGRERVHFKHLEYFVRFAQNAQKHLEGTEVTIWLARLRSDYENLRTALEWAFNSNRAFLPGKSTGF